jgi:hypothetical protein
VTHAVAVVESSQSVIAAAGDQQSTTTNELSRSVERLARTSADITVAIETVSAAVRSTAVDADHSRRSAAEAQILTNELSQLLKPAASLQIR